MLPRSRAGHAVPVGLGHLAVGLHGGRIEVIDDPREKLALQGRSSLIRVTLPDASHRSGDRTGVADDVPTDRSDLGY